MIYTDLTTTTYLAVLVLSIGACWIIYRILKNRSKKSKSYTTDESSISTSSARKYASSTLTEEVKTDHMNKIIAYMERDKAYKISHLTLGQMAETLTIPKHHLSQVINEKLGCGFIEMLNIYRVKEVKKILTEEKTNERLLMDIGGEVGFNSKSTFYAAFKKYTNKSPGKYRKELQKNKSSFNSSFNPNKMKQLVSILLISSLLFIQCGESDTLIDDTTSTTTIDLSDSDQLAIYNARTDNNDAIARHDAASVADNYIDNFFILTSTNGYFEGKENVQDIYQSVFDSRTNVLFVRNPEYLNVNKDWNMASERGNWIGTWTVDDEAIEVKGWYAAKWHKIDDTWKLRSEVYTQIECLGDVVCDDKPDLE